VISKKFQHKLLQKAILTLFQRNSLDRVVLIIIHCAYNQISIINEHAINASNLFSLANFDCFLGLQVDFEECFWSGTISGQTVTNVAGPHEFRILKMIG
jgi:hypothetical protein